MTDPRDLFRLEALRPWLEDHGFHSRDWGLPASALDRPWITFAGKELYPDAWHKAGALLDSIESSHPLLDGNKRLGVLLVSLMLRAHGIDDRIISDDQWFDLVVDVAANHPDVEIIAAKLCQLATSSASGHS